MKKLFYITLIAIVSIMQSCSEYLDETNPNQLSTDTFWTTLDESETSLTSVYGAMLDQFVLGTELDFTRTDLVYPGLGNLAKPNYGLYTSWYNFSISPDEVNVSKMWDSKYRVIWRANQLIAGLNNMPEGLKAQDRWTEQMGQARLFRGLMHFYLHSTFNNGNIIIRDKVPGNRDEFSPPLSSSEDVKAFFRKDLEYAYQNLPAQMEPKTRVDAGFAATILGTSYLYEGNHVKAMDYFKDIINDEKGDYGYALEQNASIMFTNAGDFNSESIFEINYSTGLQLEDGNFDEESFFHRLARRHGPSAKNLVTKETFGAQSWQVPAAWLVYGLSNEPMDTQDPRNYIDGDVTGTMHNVPLRGAQSIAVVNDENSIYYGYTAANINTFKNQKYAFFKKYTNHDIVTTEEATGTSGWKSGRNINVNRLSGVYLMYAECLTETGDITEALGYINDIRKRWGLQLLGPSTDATRDFDGITYNETTLMDQLMYKEYPFELALEGFSTRFLDMKRWDIQKERFQNLGTSTMHLANYTYNKHNGGTGKRNTSLVQEGPSSNGKNEVNQYVDAASLWAGAPASGTAGPYTGFYYLPLPQSEILYNPNVN